VSALNCQCDDFPIDQFIGGKFVIFRFQSWVNVVDESTAKWHLALELTSGLAIPMCCSLNLAGSMEFIGELASDLEFAIDQRFAFAQFNSGFCL
jgi:hypothetical protein